MNVAEYLKEQGVSFDLIPHEPAFTAQEVAAAEHVSGHLFAKTVIVECDGGACMLVLPASRHVDLKKAAAMVGGKVRLAGEARMKELFPDCEIGAEPPFGSAYGVRTYVDQCMEGLESIVFRAGTHDQTVRMSFADYLRLESPQMGDFAAEVG